MGTNYYLEKPCASCSNVEQQHIGKSSFGWVFHFHAYPAKNLTNTQAWRDYIKLALTNGWRIVDEYNEVMEQTDFWQLVNKKKGGNNRHDPKYGEWLDSEGNLFTTAEFS